jgi:tungstate transport system substrate-binding protein
MGGDQGSHDTDLDDRFFGHGCRKYGDTMKGNPPLKVLVKQDAILLNQYSVLAVNPKRCPKAQYDLATAFSDWMAGAEAQGLIRDFKLLGKQLFVPNAK